MLDTIADPSTTTAVDRSTLDPNKSEDDMEAVTGAGMKSDEDSSRLAVAEAEDSSRPAVTEDGMKSDEDSSRLAVTEAEDSSRPAVTEAEDSSRPAVTEAEDSSRPAVTEAEDSSRPAVTEAGTKSEPEAWTDRKSDTDEATPADVANSVASTAVEVSMLRSEGEVTSDVPMSIVAKSWLSVVELGATVRDEEARLPLPSADRELLTCSENADTSPTPSEDGTTTAVAAPYKDVVGDAWSEEAPPTSIAAVDDGSIVTSVTI